MSPNALLAVLGLTGFAANIATRIVDPIVPLLAREFDTAIATVALLATAFTLPYALGQPILGPLGDSKGKARVMSVSLFALAAALALCMVATDVTTLAIFRAVSGVAAGASIPLALAMIGDRFPLAERQVALSRYLLAVILGQITGSPMAGVLSEIIGWRPVFGIAAVIALAAGVAVRLLVQPRSDVVRPPFNLSLMRANYAKVLSNPLAKYCYGTVAVEGMCIYGFLPYVAALLESRGAGSVKEAGFVVAGIGVGGLVFSLAIKGLLTRLSRATVMRGGGFVILIGLIGVGIGPSWPLEMLAFTIVGLGFYMLHTGIQTEATELVPDARGSAVALHAFSLFIGMAIGPVIYGLMIPALGAAVSVTLGGVVILIAAWLIAGKISQS